MPDEEEIILSDDPILPKILILIILIAINAFFAAAEIAVISLSETKLEKQAEEGDKTAGKLLALMRAPDNFLSAIQVAITLAGFLSSAFAADSFSDPLVNWLINDIGVTGISTTMLNTIIVVVITIILSYFSLVFGELVPKRIAMKKTEGVARFTVGTVTAVATIFKPIIWFLSVSTNATLRLLGIDPNADEEEVSEESIRMMVDLGARKGAIESSEKEMIDNVFEFNNKTVGDIMVHRVDMVMIHEDDTPQKIMQVIENNGVSHIPVCVEDADDITGILPVRDYLLNVRKESPAPLSALIKPAYFVPELMHTDMLFQEMQKRKAVMAVVVDEYGGVAGLVSMRDVLEEIVGEVYDDLDPDDENILVRLEDNLWQVAGSCELDLLAEALEIEFPKDEEYDTLNGLVMEKVDVIPADGSQLDVDTRGLHIHVINIKDHKVESALVSKLVPHLQEEEQE